MNTIEENIVSAAEEHMKFLEFHHPEGSVDNGLSGVAQKALREMGAKALSLFITLKSEN